MSIILKNQKGSVALMTTLFIMVVSVLVLVTLLMFSLNNALFSQAVSRKKQSEALANLCAQKALYNFYTTKATTANEIIEFTEGSCSYEMLLPQTDLLAIRSSALVKNSSTKILVEVQILPQIKLLSWKPVQEF